MTFVSGVTSPVKDGFEVGYLIALLLIILPSVSSPLLCTLMEKITLFTPLTPPPIDQSYRNLIGEKPDLWPPPV